MTVPDHLKPADREGLAREVLARHCGVAGWRSPDIDVHVTAATAIAAMLEFAVLHPSQESPTATNCETCETPELCTQGRRPCDLVGEFIADVPLGVANDLLRRRKGGVEARELSAALERAGNATQTDYGHRTEHHGQIVHEQTYVRVGYNDLRLILDAASRALPLSTAAGEASATSAQPLQTDETVERLREAARAVLDSAERPGSRAEYGIGEDGVEIWHDYQEVGQPQLDELTAALATPADDGEQWG